MRLAVQIPESIEQRQSECGSMLNIKGKFIPEPLNLLSRPLAVAIKTAKARFFPGQTV